jgi:hypothetical protein
MLLIHRALYWEWALDEAAAGLSWALTAFGVGRIAFHRPTASRVLKDELGWSGAEPERRASRRAFAALRNVPA